MSENKYTDEELLDELENMAIVESDHADKALTKLLMSAAGKIRSLNNLNAEMLDALFEARDAITALREVLASIGANGTIGIIALSKVNTAIARANGENHLVIMPTPEGYDRWEEVPRGRVVQRGTPWFYIRAGITTPPIVVTDYPSAGFPGNIYFKAVKDNEN